MNCWNLEHLYTYIKEPINVDNGCFHNIPYYSTLHVPEGSLNRYLNYQRWTMYFSKVVEGLERTEISYKPYDFCVDGIYYHFSTTENEVGVTNRLEFYEGLVDTYVGNIKIPANVSFNKKNYTVTAINHMYFAGCTNMKSISLPNTIKRLENQSIQNTGIKEITIPGSVVHLGWAIFNNSYNLTSAVLEEGVPYISGSLFYQCLNLSEVTIPSSVTSISTDKPFGQCNKLKDVYSYIKKPFDISDVIFEDISSNAVLHVLKGKKELYAKFYGWTKHFSSIVEDLAEIFSLSISVSGDGVVKYNNESIRNTTQPFTVKEGSDVQITFVPDKDSYVKNVRVNGIEVSFSGNSYTIKSIGSEIKVEVIFAERDKSLSYNGINYEISSFENHTALLAEGDYGASIEIPEQITAQNETWKIAGVKENALANNSQLAAIIWNSGFAFNASVCNPNLLLYVKDASYAPSTINNVVVNGVANKITLTDSKGGNNFYCPQEFTAKSISYTHSYNMTTGISESRGWETIALPFDVQKITHASRGDLVPYSKWLNNGQSKPFWLYHFTNNGFVATDGIKAYTPYIISMPSNSGYLYEYRLNGSVTFSAENVKIAKSDNVQRASYNGKTFIPNFENQLSKNSIYALNVNNDIETYSGTESEGSVFISNLRTVHPFEAYMTSANSTSRSIGIYDNMTTAIQEIPTEKERDGIFKVYDMKGLLIKAASSIDEAKEDLPAGIYIMNQKKVIIK